MRPFAAANLQQIFHYIFLNKGIKRFELSDRLALAPASVSKYVDHLLKARAIIELHTDRSRNVALSVDPQWKKALGIDIGSYKTRLLFVHADGSRETAAEFSTPADPEDAWPQIEPYIKGIDGVGIAPTAVVDPETRTIRLFANKRRWDGFCFSRWPFGKPVMLMSSGNASAFAEKTFGSLKPYRSAIHANFGMGIQAGILLDGKIMTGAGNAAGELGHVFASPDVGKCTCGNSGCLENVATLSMVHYHLQQMAKRGELRGALAELAGNDPMSINAPMVRKAYESNDPQVRIELAKVSAAAAAALSGLVNMFNPEAISLGGMLFGFFPELVDDIRSDLLQKVLQSNSRNFILLRAEHVEWGAAYGAGLSVIADSIGRFAEVQ